MNIYVGPGGPYAKDPVSSTNIHVYVGPMGPYAKDPGRPAGGPMSVYSRQQSSQNLARKADFRPGSIIA